MILRILISLLIGLLGSLWVMEQDRDIKNVLEKYCIHMFEDAMHCTMKCNLTNIDLLKTTIVLDHVAVTPKEQAPDAWHWACQHYTIRISPWALLTRRIVSMDMCLDGIDAYSKFENNTLEIMPHIQLLASFSNVAILELKSLRLRNVHLSAHDPVQHHQINIGFNCDCLTPKNRFNIMFSWLYGKVTYAKRTIFDCLQGTIDCSIHTPCNNVLENIHCKVDCQCEIPQLESNNKQCHITGSFKHGTAQADIQSTHEKLHLGPIKINLSKDGTNAEATMHAPLSYIISLVQNTHIPFPVTGDCVGRIQVHYADNSLSIKGACGIKNLYYKTTKLASLIATTFSNSTDTWTGHIHYKNEGITAESYWNFNNKTGTGTLNFCNSSQLSSAYTPNVSIKPKDLLLNAHYTNNAIQASYKATISHDKSKQQEIIKGSLEADKNSLHIEGTFNTFSYNISGIFNPYIQLTNASLYNEKKEPIITVQSKKGSTTYKGILELKPIIPLIKNVLHIDLHGQGTLKLYGLYADNQIKLKTKLEHGTIRIPQTYIFLTGLDALCSLDLINKTIIVNYARTQFYEGNIVCHKATVIFDDSWRLSYAQLPLIINQCLFNIRKDLFGIISGNMLYTYPSVGTPELQGTILIDRTQLTENLFSGILREANSLAQQGLQTTKVLDTICNIDVSTYNPIRVNTVFLDCDARIHMHMYGPIKDPIIAGTATLPTGRLLFPYRPLYITKATITLSPGAMTDPLIDIVAKNRIKKYMISLQVSGSLQNHQVVLSSTPPLNTEQIIALLLIGSEEESLGTMIPALVMQNIKPLIFSSKRTKFLEKYVNVLLKPLQYIHFVPSFSDQTGRGGLRGKIEIDINDRWRAMIQNNFNLSEDTRFEVEYMLSDDISLKGGRDEHRDITGEVEMRWKFH
jgi:hypothetical protein